MTTIDATQDRAVEATDEQYSLAKILGIWVAAALPMPILSFVIGPALAARTGLVSGIARWLMIIVGLMWLFVLAMIVQYRELGTLRWPVIRKRMWYQTPRDPKTGEKKARLLWWALPATLLNGLVVMSPIGPTLDEAILSVFPFLRPLELSGADLASPDFVGQWWLLGVTLISMLFNYFLGEEWLFRGTLLPKMNGVFGRWDWLANVVLFSLWHWHQPWDWFAIIASFALAGRASRRFKSNWVFFIAHGADGVFMFVMVLAVVSGLAF